MYLQNPEILGYPIDPHERGKTATELLLSAIKPVTDFINEAPKRNWPYVVNEFDKYSMQAYLKYNPFGVTLSQGAIDQLKVLLTLEGFPELSFLELLRELMVLFAPNIRFYEITGGNDQLPKAFTSQLKDDILYSQKVKKIVQHDNQVTIHTLDNISVPFQITGDLAIVTIPFSALQFVKVEPSFSENKRKAIRELHYVASTKTGIQFKNRFWEREGMYGGRTVSDLPITYTQYPSSGIGTPGPGVIMDSYTWEDDAIPWDSLDEDDRLEYALKNLAAIHGKHVYREFQTMASHSWIRDPYSAGGYTMFKSEQATELAPYISTPEGRVYFAGEHASSSHGWIQGAIESGIHVAWEVNDLPRTYYEFY
jgi:monoamine oxidase